MNITDMPIDQIAVSRLNTRKDLTAGNEDSSIDDLAESIREKGLLNPVMVRVMPDGRYELIAGQRRLLACRKIGLQNIPAFIRSEVDDADATAISLIENVHRAEMNPLDKAKALAALQDKYNGDLQRVSKETAVGLPTVRKYLALLSLPDAIQERVSTSDGPARIDALAVLSRTFASPEDMMEAYDKTAGFTQEIQKQIFKATEGNVEKIDELVERAQEGAFDTKMCHGLGGKLMCEYIPPDLAESVVKLVEQWKQQHASPVNIKEFARKIKLRQS